MRLPAAIRLHGILRPSSIISCQPPWSKDAIVYRKPHLNYHNFGYKLDGCGEIPFLGKLNLQLMATVMLWRCDLPPKKVTHQGPLHPFLVTLLEGP